jgi:Immunity protein 49
MKLSQYLEDLSYDAAFWLAGLSDQSYPDDQIGQLALDVSNKLRAIAIVVLLTKGDTDTFCHDLIRSGIARITYLSRCRERDLMADHHCASGRYQPLLDPIAGGDVEVAQRIAELSPKNWMEGHEYKDDYFYAQILHRLIQATPPLDEIGRLISEFEAYEEGRSIVRLDLCRALAVRDQGAFDSTFDGLLNERSAEINAGRERGELEEPYVIAQRQVFVEGLAILRLAKMRGLKTEQDYLYCPSIAREPMKTPFPGE